MNAKAERKERSHETILESAVRLVRERGIAGASVGEVMKGAGMTVGGFYAHFASKEELVDEALRRTAKKLLERLFAGIEEKPPTDRVEVLLKRYLSVAHRDEQTMGCPLPAVVGEVGTTAGEHGEVVAELVDALAGRLAEQLPRGKTASARVLALGLVALMFGGLSLARAVRGTELSDEIIRACRQLGTTAARGMSKT